tara:strand:+ start:1411 stop:2301 length:891 start_codon:yes stop_codon:yes gene_type:complete
MHKIKTSQPEVLWNSKCILGEGVTWVKEHNSLYYVDIKRKKIFKLNYKNKNKKIYKIEKEIGFLAHVSKNTFVLGLQGEIRIVDLKKKNKKISIKIEKKFKNNRINDGKTDHQGRLWFGTMDNLERNIHNGSLYCLDSNFNLNQVDKNYMITNGPAFINKRCFYHTDSKKKIVYKIYIDKNLKVISKKIFIKFRKNEGSPDGMTLDNYQNLWICHYNGSCISVYNKKGNKLHSVNMPTKNITNCTFGGYRNSELFVTTAIKGMSKKELKLFPLSGNLFKIKTNVFGMINKKFKINL